MDIFKLLQEARDRNASDLHLVADNPPLLRIYGTLNPSNDTQILDSSDIELALTQLTSNEERRIFQEEKELDFGYSLTDVGRLRCNAAIQRGAVSLAIRLLPFIIPTIEELELPSICKTLVTKPRGLIIVTGPTGSGKSTTLAAMLTHLNQTQSSHIVTIEDPIEYVFSSQKCAISQRQLGTDTLSFAQALKHVLRQNPDVIMVGEMRDIETAAAVLTIAETGHLVLSTGHAPSAYQALERIIDFFPPHERHLAQTRLASLIEGVLCQTLVPRADGSGLIAAVEVMLANTAVRSLIREGKVFQLPNAIRSGHDIGMSSLDESLFELYIDGVITPETVFSQCRDPEEIQTLLTGRSSKKGRRK
jgi:twitching motility protein PilT